MFHSCRYSLSESVDTEGNLGALSMGIMYVSFTLFAVAASPVVRWLGARLALVVGTSGYALFILANLLPTWCVLAHILTLGLASDRGFAVIYLCNNGTYLTSAALSHARDNNLPDRPAVGRFNGEFWGVFASTQVIGNLISFAVLRNRKDRRMLLLIPLMAYSGLQQAFVWAVFTKSIVTPVLGLSGIGGAMAVYGVADVVCSLVAGRFTSGLQSATFIVSVGAILQAAVLFWLLLFHRPMGGLLGAAAPLLIGALWGVGNGVLNTQLSALLGLLFEDVKKMGFCVV
uniref:Uncharacterized protein n=1 Tax=Aegilops tauschii subsp. strangulata TaxID=200361 RepID=A0A453JXN8_AEGTS